MNKNTSKLLAAALATSAIVVPVSGASAATNVEPGIYFAATGEFYTTAQLENLSIQKIGELFSKNTTSQVYIYLAGVGTASLAQANASDFITAANGNGSKDAPENIIPGGTYVGNGTSIVIENPSTALKVESVSAINKTTVKLVLNKSVDSVTADNFSIEGGNVTAASLAEDKKTVTLSVSGLAYATEYTVEATDILVDGTASDFGSKAFTTPAVTDLWELQISTLDADLIADGSDNTEVTFKLIDKTTGKVDTAADNVVLDLNTTYGTLAQKRVTVQDGVATVLLTSEFSNTDISAKIDAQIIEASGDYKDLINHVAGTVLVPFKTSTTDKVETITLVSAEANQADRVTLFFDKEVNLKHFVATNSKGELYYTVGAKTDYLAKDLVNTPAENILHTLIDTNNIQIAQGTNTDFDVKGLKPVAGNPKAIEVILEKETVLKDNAAVEINVTTVNSLGKATPSSAEFKVTDARKPEATSVTPENLNSLKVKFSEAISDATFQIDGEFKGVKLGEDASSADFTYVFGEFNPTTLVDNRDLATIRLTDNYLEAGDNKVAGYFGAGQHTVQVSSTKDFAYATDSNNIGSTQNLTFNIAADSAKPSATVTVESPEQFRIKFNKAVKIADVEEALQLQKYNTTTEEYEDDNTVDYIVNPVAGTNEYLVELIEDWTTHYDTGSTNKNYYNDKYQFVIAKGAVTNVSNGATNDKITLDLNYSGSPLNSADVTSPVISSIDRVTAGSEFFNVTMSEPVKLAGHVEEDQTETLAQGQTSLQATTVQFLGKDKDGKAVTFNGTVEGYADTNDADKVLEVTWTAATDANGNQVTPQTVVDAGGSEDWTLVVRSISDDVGNTAASATKNFKIAKSPAGESPFFVDYTGTGNAKAYKVFAKGNGNAADTIEITYSEGVQFSGASDATNPAQYTLNGVTLPTGTSISIANDDSATHATTAGKEKVIISLPDGTLNLDPGKSNVITINKNLVSYDGSKIQGATEIVVINLDAINAGEALDEAVASTEGLVETDYTAATWTALEQALALPETTNAEIVAKTTAINEAIENLVFAGQADLNTAVASTEGLVEADYTEATWTVLEQALALPETTNAEIVAKTTAINEAVEALEAL